MQERKLCRSNYRNKTQNSQTPLLSTFTPAQFQFWGIHFVLKLERYVFKDGMLAEFRATLRGSRVRGLAQRSDRHSH